MAKPRKIAAPKSTVASDLSSVLGAIAKSNKPSGVRRSRAAQNPSRVSPDTSLRITRSKLPTASELLRDTAAPLGEGLRSRAVQLPTPTGMPTASELLELGGGPGPMAGVEEGEERVDRTEYLSPPPSIEPGRPRALQAQYNPDTRVMNVTFRDGGTYAYFGVPPQTWRALKGNRSFGQTLDRLVINRYQYEKVSF